MTSRGLSRARFAALVAEALREIPARFREHIQNVTLVMEDEPDAQTLDEAGVDPPDTLYGLYQGTPLTERRWADGNVLPDRITLYQVPIEEDCEDEDDIRQAISETLIHEVGHYFGLSEEEIEAIEEQYWRGQGR
jgi:predicted Zn-dependent protease with MMP-like domain